MYTANRKLSIPLQITIINQELPLHGLESVMIEITGRSCASVDQLISGVLCRKYQEMKFLLSFLGLLAAQDCQVKEQGTCTAHLATPYNRRDTEF